MQRSCDSCGRRYPAQRSTSRFCSATCRSRHRGTPRPPRAAPADDSALVQAVQAELFACRQSDTALGHLAVTLARALTDPDSTAAGAAAVSRELRAVMSAARSQIVREVDPVDELRNRRRRKRRAQPKP